MSRLAKFLYLPAPDKVALMQCLLTVIAIRAGLSLFSYRHLRRWLRQKADHTPSEAAVRRIVWGVTNSARLVPSASCLTMALAAQYRLARAGYHSQIRIGVAKDAQGRFVAHAWLVSGDRVMMGGSSRELQRYAKLTDLSLGAL